MLTNLMAAYVFRNWAMLAKDGKGASFIRLLAKEGKGILAAGGIPYFSDWSCLGSFLFLRLLLSSGKQTLLPLLFGLVFCGVENC